jgi:hypothetical protein
MLDRFLNRLFEITKRLYYLIFVSIFLGSIISLTYFYLFTDRSDSDWARIGFICLLLLPLARIFHIAVNWIVWGKLK